MPSFLLTNFLNEVSAAEDEDARWGALSVSSHWLLQRPEIAVELAQLVSAMESVDEGTVGLLALETLLDSARIDAENRGARGPAVLDALESFIAGGGDMTDLGISLLGRCYIRAGLQPPAPLIRSGSDILHATDAGAAMPNLDELIDEMRDEARGDPYTFHAALSEMLGTVEKDIQETLIAAVLDKFDPAVARLGCYWLLDASPDIRQVAADAVLSWARQGQLDRTLRSSLISLRNWMTADRARLAVDQALKAALRLDVAGDPVPGPWTLHRTLASIPDGAGAQSFALAAHRDGKHCLLMALLKQAYGVRDAYVVPCTSVKEQKERLAFIESEMDAIDVNPALLSTALKAALGENTARGEPPPHGLLDIVEICGFDLIAPQEMTVHDWLGELDPKGSLSGLSKQKLGRLVNAGTDWPTLYRLLESWFEDGPEIDALLMKHVAPRSQEAALWRYLEARRHWWAMLTVRAAATISAQPDASLADWQPVAAMALALEEGRPARKVPILQWVHDLTLDSADEPWAGLTDLDDEDTIAGPAIDFALPAPERSGELRRLIKDAGMDISPAWLDGYLAAMVVAPQLPRPSAWLDGLLSREHDFKDEAQLQRFLDLVMLRYIAANEDLADSEETRARLKSYGKNGLRQWARGFTDAKELNRSVWPSRDLRKDDKAILRQIAATGDGSAEPSELLPLLSTWLQQRHKLRR